MVAGSSKVLLGKLTSGSFLCKLLQPSLGRLPTLFSTPEVLSVLYVACLKGSPWLVMITVLLQVSLWRPRAAQSES